jgi:hypothetical protein
MQRKTRSGPASVLGTTGLATWNIMPRATLLGAHAAVCTACRVRNFHGGRIAAGIPFGLDAA